MKPENGVMREWHNIRKADIARAACCEEKRKECCSKILIMNYQKNS